MADTNALLNLRDIHMPLPVSAWPPGPGYFVIAACVAAILIGYVLYRTYRRKGALIREALAKLDILEQDYQNQVHSTQYTAANITTLLKRVALVYHPRAQVASLSGADWICFLNQTSKELDFSSVSESILDSPFNPKAKEPLSPLFDITRLWLKQRRGKCLS